MTTSGDPLDAVAMRHVTCRGNLGGNALWPGTGIPSPGHSLGSSQALPAVRQPPWYVSRAIWA
jgi:hypothetical protein